jgi:iron complex transport system substrate-binding protein
MKKLISLTLALVLIAALAAACNGDDSIIIDAIEEVSFTDSAGRAVRIPREITRVSPSGAMAQQFLLAIAPDLLVSNSSEYRETEQRYIPAEILALPVTGSFYGTGNFNPESVAAIAPEIVIDVGELRASTVEDMDQIAADLAVPAVFIEATLRTAPEAFRTLGAILDREERGEELASFLEIILDQTDRLMAQVGDNRASMLYLLGDLGQNVLAQGSFHSEVIDFITDNIAVVDSPAARGTGNEVDMETIMLWNPEVIIFAPNSVFDTAADDPVWSNLRAISGGRFYEVPLGPYNWMGNPPSINRYLGMIWLPLLLYPEYVTYDAGAQIREYYRLFYHYDLGAEEFAALTANSLGR